MQIKKIFATFLASKFSTNLQLKYCCWKELKHYKICLCKIQAPDNLEKNLERVLEKINAKSMFLSIILRNHCNALFLLKRPSYGFQLNNGIFYINQALIEEGEINTAATVLLQLLYQRRVYRKLGISNRFYISSIEQTDYINRRFMGKAWLKYKKL